MANPFKRADRHGAPSIRPTPPESAEKPMPDPMTGTRELPGETRETSRSTGHWRLQAPIRQWNHRRRSTSHQQRARGLAGKPLAGFRTTPSRRITVVYGVIVYAIRFKTSSLHR